VGTIQNTTLWEQFKIPHSRNNAKYNTVGTIQNNTLSEQLKNTTLSEQFKNTTLSEQFKIPHCGNNSKYHTVGKIPKSNIKILEMGKIDTPNTQINEVVHLACRSSLQFEFMKSKSTRE
jgi:hypothetical protein